MLQSTWSAELKSILFYWDEVENEYERILRRSLLCHIIKIDFFHIFCTCNFFFLHLRTPYILILPFSTVHRIWEDTLLCYWSVKGPLTANKKKSFYLDSFFFLWIGCAGCLFHNLIHYQWFDIYLRHQTIWGTLSELY